MRVFIFLTLCGLLFFPGVLVANGESANAQMRIVMDMFHVTPGEKNAPSAFRDPQRLVEWGYNEQVIGSVAGVQLFDSVVPGLLPEGSVEREWALKKAATLEESIRAGHAAGLKCYAGTDLIVLPKALVQRFKSEICDEKGRISIYLPKTQDLLRAMFRETFDRFPDLDGIIIRTGEVYLHDFPYHTASGIATESKIQSNTAILRGPESHIEILKILRDEVCVKRGKMVFYRTWDFGAKGFHENPDYYLRVTNAIEPHPNLIFSVKHQKGDFHQLTPFNPTLMIGKHRQIVEVQCQREAYGKGAHPYYIGQGVIEGWEEYSWIMKPNEAQGLRDIINHPLCAGVWTWSRGGGWEGPYITNEFWCALNAYVISQYAQNPTRKEEEEIFDAYAALQGLKGEEVARFRELCLLSTKAVLRGQLTCLGARIDVWWARDHFLGQPDLSDFIAKGLVDQALAEKAEAVEMWKHIEMLARQLHFTDAATQEFVETSTTYGRIKYAIIEQGWIVLMLGAQAEKTDHPDPANVAKVQTAIAAYDSLWKEWRELAATHPACSTLYKDIGFGNKPGLGAAINHYRAQK